MSFSVNDHLMAAPANAGPVYVDCQISGKPPRPASAGI